MKDLLLKFLFGGAAVSIFSLLGDAFKPKTFAGLFSAAPSIALASLGLAAASHGAAYASVQARSMLAGAAAFFIYACAVNRAARAAKASTLTATAGGLLLWLAAALALWRAALR